MDTAVGLADETPAPTGPAAEPEDGPGFRAMAVAVVLVALALRLAYAWATRHNPLNGDPYFYHGQANLLADGKGFVNPLAEALTGSGKEAADHPPLFVLYLAAWSIVGADTAGWHLLASALLGTASVALVLLAGARLGGPRVGLIAGLVAALAPNLWVWDGLLAAETMAIFAVAGQLLAVTRYLGAPTRRGLAWVAVWGALAGLSRAELVLLVLVVVPLVLRTEPLDRRRQLQWLAVAGAAAAVAMAPWVAYNMARFDKPVTLSTGMGLVMVSSSCDATWYGPAMGYWDFACSTAGATSARSVDAPDSSVGDERMRAVALRYIGDHPTRLPAVVAARVGRSLGLYRPVQQAQLTDTTEGGEPWIAGSVMAAWYLLAGLAVVGAIEVRRRGVPLLPLAAPVLVVVITAALTYGIARFRAPAEVAVVLLAAVGIDRLVRSRAEGGLAPEAGSLLASFAARPVAVGDDAEYVGEAEPERARAIQRAPR